MSTAHVHSSFCAMLLLINDDNNDKNNDFFDLEAFYRATIHLQRKTRSKGVTRVPL